MKLILAKHKMDIKEFNSNHKYSLALFFSQWAMAIECHLETYASSFISIH